MDEKSSPVWGRHEKVDLTAFRLVKQIHKHNTLGTNEGRNTYRPQALLEGHLTVGDPQRFTELLAHGLDATERLAMAWFS